MQDKLQEKMLTQEEERDWSAAWLRIGQWLFLLLIAGCALTGGGHYLEFGPVTPRMILGAGVLICTVPLLWKERAFQIRNPIMWLTLAAVLWLVMEAVRGFVQGNNRLVLMTDIKGFAWLFLVPCAQVLVRSRKMLENCVKAMVIGASLQAVICIGINFYMLFAMPPHSTPEIITVLNYINVYAHEVQWGAVDYGLWEAYRIFCSSSLFLAIGACVLFFELMRSEKPWRTGAHLFLLVFALLMTCTRSLFGAWLAGMAAVAVLVLLFYPEYRRPLWQRSLVTLGLGFVALELLEVIFVQGYLEYAVARTFQFDMYRYSILRLRRSSPETWDRIVYETQKTDPLRGETKEGILDLFRANPAAGAGLGATAPTRDEPDEYFYLDMLARTGFVGTALYLSPIGYSIARFLLPKLDMLRQYREGVIILSTLAVLLVATYYNPWLNAVLGISWMAVVLAVVTVLKREKEGNAAHES
ncbi:MAG: hypothetical protein ILP12_00805 [Lachnospiraceae bacterium]|nr:hypothetical protein [Lachnospiraceae bacterium]